MHNDAIQFLTENQAALSYTGKASIRQRRLPAEQVVWLVVVLHTRMTPAP
jgi:hypothetical protein